MALTLDFVHAGKAIFTVANPDGKHYTFQVKKAKDPHPVHGDTFFAALLTGPNNEEDYTYLGLLRGTKLQTTKKSPEHLAKGVPGRALQFALRILAGTQPLPPGYKVHHEGRCGRCGRTLTVPSSIESGIGPECAKKGGF
jgi:hypothetical protein